MLRVTDLVVRYGRTTALHGVSFEVHQGEVVAVVGPNGAGKSTTLKAVTGLVTPASGEIEFDGRSILRSKPEDLLRQGLALVPEGRNVFSSLTVEENLLVGAGVTRNRADGKRAVAEAMERFPALERRRTSPAGKLSGGEQQQLAIARALIARPRLLLLDEPSLGLAPLIVDQIFQVISDLRADGTTVLLIEQNATRAVALADRSYVLRTGEVALSGDSASVLAHEDFLASYLGVSQDPAPTPSTPVTHHPNAEEGS